MNVSVLIPVYNCRKYIGAAIESVLAQTFQDFDIIVVDDGSLDETASIVKKYPRVLYIYQTHQGVAAARNRAIKEAKSDWISFLDADDLMVPEKLEKQVAYMEKNPECKIVFCKYKNFTELKLDEMTSSQRRLIEKTLNPRRLAGALIHIDLFQKWGGFDTKLNVYENMEWLTGLRSGGVDLGHRIEEVLYLRRIHAENMSLDYSEISGNERFRLLADSIRRSRRGDRKQC